MQGRVQLGETGEQLYTIAINRWGAISKIVSGWVTMMVRINPPYSYRIFKYIGLCILSWCSDDGDEIDKYPVLALAD